MIRSFRHRGLERLYAEDDARGVRADQVKRLKRILFLIDTATEVAETAVLPGLRLHRLVGDLAGHWSLSVSGNWRVIFRFEAGEAYDVDLVDYH